MGAIKFSFAGSNRLYLPEEPKPRLYAGDGAYSGGYIDSNGNIDVSGPLRDLRQNVALRQQARKVERGILPPPGGGGGAASPIVSAVQEAKALQEVQAIEDRADYNFPASVGIIEAQSAGAGPLTNGNGVTPPRDFFLCYIVIQGTAFISIERFEVMGENLTYGVGSVGASQFRTDTTLQKEFNMVLDTVPIVFDGTVIVAGTIEVTMIGFLRKVRGRRG
jgi:hypothetical protein